MFGTRIVTLRKERGLTQSQLAQELGISRSSLSLYEIEKREPDTETLFKISNYFGVSTDYLLGLEDVKISEEELSYRFPEITNRFGQILRTYQKEKNITSNDFAKSISISPALERDIEIGIQQPSMDLLKRISEVTNYNIDYLTGADDASKSYYDFTENKQKIFRFAADFHFRSRFESLCIKNGVNDSNCLEKLGLSHSDYINITSNRMPTLSELLRISYAFDVSVDYLIGKSDYANIKLSDDELELILNYRDCLPMYKKNIRNRASELSIASLEKSSTDERRTAK